MISRRFPLLCLACVLAATPARARLVGTAKQCEERYGKPWGEPYQVSAGDGTVPWWKRNDRSAQSMNGGWLLPFMTSDCANRKAEAFREKQRAAPLAADEVEEPGITAIVRKQFPEGSEGGLALLVIRDHAVLHSKGYGLKDGKSTITPETRMGLASVTKQFAAMCAAFLIEEGKLSLADPVSKFLPNLDFRAEGEGAGKGRELLVRDLLWHTSGLPNFIKAEEKASIEQYKKKHGLERLNNETHAEWLATLPLRRPPGMAFEYTNSGYVLLARIIEIVAEKPFHEFQKERIFDFLGMTNTKDSTRFNGSGNLGTTLEDYAKWDRALWDGTLLEEETAKLLFQSGTLDNGEPVGYGFGWNVEFDQQGDLREVWHGGAGSPKGHARNIVSRDLRNRITVVLFVRENRNFSKAVRRAFAEAVKEHVLEIGIDSVR